MLGSFLFRLRWLLDRWLHPRRDPSRFEVRHIGNATLYCGDAVAILSQLPITFDALITDPPYSSGGMMRGDRMQSPAAKYVTSSALSAVHNVSFSGDNRDGRSWAFWASGWLGQCRQVLNPGAYVLAFIDWRMLPHLTDALQAGGLIWRGIVPWDKTESSRAPHTGYFRHQCEYVVWGSNGPLPKAAHGGPWPGVIRERVKPAEKLHMTGKPVPLMSQLMQCVVPGGIVLDPFMGSASTGVAALQSGRRFVGIECDRHAFEIACARIAKLVETGNG